MADALGGKDKPIDFGSYIGGEEALQIAARSLRSLKKDVTDLSKTVADDSGRIKAGFETIKSGIADIQSKAGRLNLFSGEDKAVLAALAQQLGELKKRQEDYKATQASQATIQRGLTDTAKQYTSELAKQKDALRAAALAQDVEGQKAAAAAIRQTTQETAQLSKALRGANSELTAAKGSYDALVIENNKLLASLHALEAGLNSGSQEALKLKRQIYDNTQTLKDFDEATNRNFRNVGNYAQSFSGLIAELAKARAAQSSFTEGTADAARNQMRIAGFQTAAQKAAANMGLSFEQAEAKINGVTASIQPLATSLVRLEQEQREVARTAGEESKEFQVLGFQIQKTRKEIDDVAAAQTKAADNTAGLTEQLGFSKDGLKEFAIGLAAGAIGLQAILSGVESVFQANVEYSRNLAEVRKTTGLTADEAERLAQSLKNLDTPTSLAGLLKIASVGGQLGIAKGDLLEFTKAIDTAVQALGNDFAGGAEEIATVLGKISSVFGKELGNDPAKNILAIGSAVNQLGADGAATAPFLTDVALRVGALSASTGVGLKNVLAYAAVLQETGSTSEVAGTALNRFFGTLTTKTKEAYEIAKLANPALTLKEFTHLVNTDFNQAIQVFLRGLKEGGKSTTDQARLLATLKLQSGEAKNAIITLSQNTELFTARQQTANEQLREGTSLAAEAAVNSETLGGSVDKLTNDLKNFATNGAGGAFLKFLIDTTRVLYQSTIGDTLRAIGDGIDYVKEKTGLSKKALDDYSAAITNTALSVRKQADAQQQLLDNYSKLAGQASRTGAEERQLSELRAQLGTADVAAVQQQIDERRKQFEGIKAQFHRDLDGFNTDIDNTNTRIARLQDALLVQGQRLTTEQLSQSKQIAKVRLEAETNGRPVTGKSSNPELELAISAALRLERATQQLAEKERNRANLMAGLAKLEGVNAKAKKDAADATIEEADAELQLDRTAQERAKNRANQLRDELADNQKRIDAIKAYQAQQAKLFADKQITPEIFAENVRGSEDLITQLERGGTAIRISIARAEADEKLAIAENDRIRQSKKKKITGEELADIQGQYAARSVEIERQKVRKIAEINEEAGKRQGAVEPLEFKLPVPDIQLLRSRLGEFVKTYESELTDIKNAEQAREKDLIGQLSRREISQNEFEKRASQSRIRAANDALELDKKYHKATLEEQKAANEAVLAEQNRLTNERIAKIEAIGYYTQEAESAFFAIKGNFIDADIQRTQAAYDNEIKAAGENSELKLQVQNKYDKELKKLNYEKAKAERDGALFSIAINTAIAVAKSFAKSPETFGLPFSAIAIGEGILQAAVVLSKPLPQYFKGRKGGPAELAEVAERGPEIIERKATKRFEYVSTRAVAHLGAGDNVYTAEQTTEMLAAAGLRHSEAQQPGRVAAAFSGAAADARAGREAERGQGIDSLALGQAEIAAALRKFKPTVVHVHRGSDASVQTSQSLTHYYAQRTFKKD
jgi:TP901 family phage tail tape measure protein